MSKTFPKKAEPFWKLVLAFAIVTVVITALQVIRDEYLYEEVSIEERFQSAYEGYSEENAIGVLDHVIYNQERGFQIGYDVYEVNKLTENTFYVRTELMEIELEIKGGDGHTGYRLTEWNSGRELVVSVDY